MRAAASLPESARLVGINTSWMIALGWGMATAIGAIAGMMIAPVVFLEPNMMGGILLYGFAAAVLGGLTSPFGAVVGGFLVGVFENLVGTYIPGVGNEYETAIALALIIVVLVIKSVRPQNRAASLIMSTVQESVSQPAAVAAPSKKSMTVSSTATLVVLAALLISPLFVKNFIIFQMTTVLIYAIAILSLNLLTGGSGQFSLGQSAFYAVGAYTAGILMEHFGVNYVLTLPAAGIICFIFGFPVRVPGAAALGRVSRARDLRAGRGDAANPQAQRVRALDRRRPGPCHHQAGRAVRPEDVAGHVALLLHAVRLLGDLHPGRQPAAQPVRTRHDGDP